VIATMDPGRRFVVVALSLIVLTGAAPIPPLLAQPAAPAPPRVFLDTTYTPPGGRTIAVRAGGDLQSALNTAQPGDIIALEPGAVFRGNFSLPKKTGTGWIVVRSGAPDEKLPSPGTRVTPAFSPVMPKILSPNSNPALFTEPGAHHYRFIGIEFAVAPNVKRIYSIVAFGGTQSSEAETPHDLILDRCFVHGEPALMTSRGVLLNSASSAIIDSHVSEIHAAGYDSQAVLGYNGPGPFKIVNNFLEGAAENVMFGGADPKLSGLVPSDIEIRQNHLFKPLSWRKGNPGFGGVQWTIKNLLELKNAQRVLIEGNLLENNWGPALLLTPRNQEGTAPWSVVQDVVFRSNIVKNAASGFIMQASDDVRPSQRTKRIAIVNNLWLGITRRFFGMAGGPAGPLEDLLIDHNTAIPVGYATYFSETSVLRFRLTNNLFGFGAFGVGFPKADEGLAKRLPGAVIAKNALASLADTGDGRGASRNRPHYINQTMYTSFPDAAAAGLNPDGTLTPTSRNRQAGTDGKDIGVDFAELRRAMAWAAGELPQEDKR
jgi:hypothetical protein